MPDNCEKCTIKQELLNLAIIVRNVLGDSKRFTWSEKAMYKIEVEKIVARLEKE